MNLKLNYTNSGMRSHGHLLLLYGNINGNRERENEGVVFVKEFMIIWLFLGTIQKWFWYTQSELWIFHTIKFCIHNTLQQNIKFGVL